MVFLNLKNSRTNKRPVTTGLFCRLFRRVNEIIFYIVLNTLYYVQLSLLGRGHHHLVIIVSPWQLPCAMCHCSGGGVDVLLLWCCCDVVVVSHPPPPCCRCIAATSSLLSSRHGNHHMCCIIIIVMVWMCYCCHHITPTSSLLSLHHSHLIVVVVLLWQSPCALCHHRHAGVDMPLLTSSSSPSHLCRSWPLHHRVGVMVGGQVVALVVATSPTPVVFGSLHWWWPHHQCLWWPG